jgi:DNA-binding GntR family transcriptional regulator
MATGVGCSSEARPRDMTELRLLVELPALRKLADRGLSDGELGVIRKLADATVRSARSGDLLGYLQADMFFHLYLLELTGDPVLSEVGRLLLAPGPTSPTSPTSPRHGPGVEERGYLMAAGAREHCELVDMLADDMLSAADDLLRCHVSAPRASLPAPARYLPGRNPSDLSET